jgi:L-fucose dehydrogenase
MRQLFINWNNYFMDLELNNKVIIVTGGARGIGEGISRVLSAEGAIVVIVGRNEADNRALQVEIEEAGGHAFAVAAELNDPEACEKTVRAVIQKFGRIEGLVNNATLNDGGPETGNNKRFMESLHKSLAYYYLMTQFALPHLKTSKGAIVNINYKKAGVSPISESAYAAVNGGRNALTREWAVELLKYGIRVNSIIVTESPSPQENRITTPKEIAHAVAFLLSGKSSHTTGQLITVDGEYADPDRMLATT